MVFVVRVVRPGVLVVDPDGLVGVVEFVVEGQEHQERLVQEQDKENNRKQALAPVLKPEREKMLRQNYEKLDCRMAKHKIRRKATEISTVI